MTRYQGPIKHYRLTNEAAAYVPDKGVIQLGGPIHT